VHWSLTPLSPTRRSLAYLSAANWSAAHLSPAHLSLAHWSHRSLAHLSLAHRLSAHPSPAHLSPTVLDLPEIAGTTADLEEPHSMSGEFIGAAPLGPLLRAPGVVVAPAGAFS
jgi:hypothetical protein